MGIIDRVAGVVERVAASLRSPLAPTDVKLAGVSPSSSSRRAKQRELEDQLRTWLAYSGRITTDAGPSGDRFSTYPGTDLTPETIINAQREAVSSGLPLRWVEMIDQILSRDGHYAGVSGQRVEDVVKGTWRLTRATNDDVSTAVRNFVEVAYRETERFTDGLGWLLWANAYCYTGVEPEWEERRVTFPGPRGERIGPLSLAVPKRLWQVHPKHFRFDQRTDEPLLWLGQDGVSLPYGKLIFHTGEGLHPLAVRRGHAWQCVWYSLFRSIGWAGWATFVDRFAMPVPVLKYNGDLAQYDEYSQAMVDIQNSLGTGKGVRYPRDNMELELKDPPRGGGSSDPHSALSDACDAGQSIRVLGATLTAKIGNVGSFAASSTHAEVKYAKEENDARRLWETVDEQLTKPLVAFNAAALARALSDAGYPTTPEEVLSRAPRGKHRVPRESDPMAEMQIAALAVNQLGLPLSAEGLFDRMDFPRALSDEDRVPGASQAVAKGGALVPNAEAAKSGGVVNPDTEGPADAGERPAGDSPESTKPKEE